MWLANVLAWDKVRPTDGAARVPLLLGSPRNSPRYVTYPHFEFHDDCMYLVWYSVINLHDVWMGRGFFQPKNTIVNWLFFNLETHLNIYFFFNFNIINWVFVSWRLFLNTFCRLFDIIIIIIIIKGLIHSYIIKFTSSLNIRFLLGTPPK